MLAYVSRINWPTQPVDPLNLRAPLLRDFYKILFHPDSSWIIKNQACDNRKHLGKSDSADIVHVGGWSA